MRGLKVLTLVIVAVGAVAWTGCADSKSRWVDAPCKELTKREWKRIQEIPVDDLAPDTEEQLAFAERLVTCEKFIGWPVKSARLWLGPDRSAGEDGIKEGNSALWLVGTRYSHTVYLALGWDRYGTVTFMDVQP